MVAILNSTCSKHAFLKDWMLIPQCTWSKIPMFEANRLLLVAISSMAAIFTNGHHFEFYLWQTCSSERGVSEVHPCKMWCLYHKMHNVTSSATTLACCIGVCYYLLPSATHRKNICMNVFAHQAVYNLNTSCGPPAYPWEVCPFFTRRQPVIRPIVTKAFRGHKH